MLLKLTTNRSHLITTALNAHAAGLIAREWGGDPPAGAITALPRRTFIAQVTHHGKLTHPFLFHNESVEEHFAAAYKPDAIPQIEPVIDRASGRASTAETIRALDTLDERIRQHLQKAHNSNDGETRTTAASDHSADEPWRAPAPVGSIRETGEA